MDFEKLEAYVEDLKEKVGKFPSGLENNSQSESAQLLGHLVVSLGQVVLAMATCKLAIDEICKRLDKLEKGY